MTTAYALLLFVFGFALVWYFAEKLVQATVGTARGFGLSTFLISVIFIGFDPENLAVGAMGSYQGVAGIALGTIIGAGMVAIALAFGLTATLAPMRFAQAPAVVLAVPVLAIALLGALALDGELSRLDGAVLLAGFVGAIALLLYQGRRGLTITPSGEVAESLADTGKHNRWQALGWLLLSLVALVIGSKLLVDGATRLLAHWELSATLLGMTVLALLISVEEVARELPAAWKGRPEISYGNVAGSALAFFLFNAGIIALVQPVPVDDTVLHFYLPVCLLTVLVVSALMWRKQVPRWAGVLLLALYALFFVGGYGLAPTR